MLKKNDEIKWSDQENKSFAAMKLALTKAPVLVSLDFSKYFLTFFFSLEETIDAVLLHRICEGFEKPIAFFSQALRDAYLKYSLMEKQAYALLKALKSFRIYILQSHIVAYVPNTTVKDILIWSYSKGKRGCWIVNILEYDLEIMPTK